MNTMHSNLFDQTNGVIDLDVEAVRMDAMTADERLAESTSTSL